MTEPRQDHQDHVLCLRGLHVHYGSICALRDVTLDLACGTAVALVGGNGAGKTTTFYMITGMVKSNAGKIFIDDENITKIAMYRRARSTERAFFPI